MDSASRDRVGASASKAWTEELGVHVASSCRHSKDACSSREEHRSSSGSCGRGRRQFSRTTGKRMEMTTGECPPSRTSVTTRSSWTRVNAARFAKMRSMRDAASRPVESTLR